MKSLTGIVIAAALAATPTLAADCNGSHALDRCLIGTWQFASGGGADWMKRNMPNVHTTGTSPSNIKITLRPDGTFSSTPIDMHTTATAAQGHVQAATAHIAGQAMGVWSAGGGKLTLCTQGISNTVTVVIGGKPHTISQPIKPSLIAYTCNAATMTTTRPMPRGGPIVTTYSRSH